MKLTTFVTILKDMVNDLDDAEIERMTKRFIYRCESRMYSGLPKIPAEVSKLVDGGDYIQAIKLYRDMYGVMLREAKFIIDSYKYNKDSWTNEKEF